MYIQIKYKIITYIRIALNIVYETKGKIKKNNIEVHLVLVHLK